MVNLTFGEQVKIILSRKGMTIKQLAELVESHTGKPMSRQNMTQRLGRDNFQEQDMRLIAEILGCKFQLSIMDMEAEEEEALGRDGVGKMLSAELEETKTPAAETQAADELLDPLEREITVGELVDMVEEPEASKSGEESQEDSSATETGSTEALAEIDGKVGTATKEQERELLKKGVRGYFKKAGNAAVAKQDDTGEEKSLKEDKSSEEAPVVGDINPYTGKEYKSNSVRMHPKRIGYVQVYDQEQHKWTDMTEWAFLGYQERKKVLLGKDYEPPIYLD